MVIGILADDRSKTNQRCKLKIVQFRGKSWILERASCRSVIIKYRSLFDSEVVDDWMDEEIVNGCFDVSLLPHWIECVSERNEEKSVEEDWTINDQGL